MSEDVYYQAIIELWHIIQSSGSKEVKEYAKKKLDNLGLSLDPVSIDNVKFLKEK